MSLWYYRRMKQTMSNNLLDRLYNWKFGAAAEYLDGMQMAVLVSGVQMGLLNEIACQLADINESLAKLSKENK
jgi:hypothetical protein